MYERGVFYLAPSDGPAKVEVRTEVGNSSTVTVQFLPPKDPNGPLYLYKLQFKMGKVGTQLVAFGAIMPHQFDLSLMSVGQLYKSTPVSRVFEVLFHIYLILPLNRKNQLRKFIILKICFAIYKRNVILKY